MNEYRRSAVSRAQLIAAPFAAAQALLLALAVADDVRIEAEARVVDEDAAVHLADVDEHRPSSDDATHGRGDIERHAEIPGEMVERAEREHAECDLAADQRGDDGADGAVAAAGDDDVGMLRLRRLDLRAQFRAMAHVADVDRSVGRHEERAQPVRHCVVVTAARAGVEDDDEASRHGEAAWGASAARQRSASAPRLSVSQAMPSRKAAPTSVR